eukprot:119894-Pelagomonas_calceolata.AAC.1
MKEDALPSTDNRLFPWECREACSIESRSAVTFSLPLHLGDSQAQGAPYTKARVIKHAHMHPSYVLDQHCASDTGLTYKGAFTITINWAREDGSAEGSFVKKQELIEDAGKRGALTKMAYTIHGS